MKNKNIAAMGVRADSVDGFKCAMGNCEDNCCHNTTWSIYVDESTLEKYKAMNDELGEFILNCIEKGDNGLYKFKKFDHGRCPILTDKGLCLIHRDLGEEFLCRTCKAYPRIWEEFNGKLEFWLALSCPNAIRWVLYRKKRINYTNFPIWTEAPMTATPADSEKSLVRDMLVKILHHRKFTLKEKIIYMGLFMRSLDKNPVNEAIKTYDENMRTSGFMQKLMAGTGTVHPDNRNFIIGRLAQLAAVFISDTKISGEAFDRLVVPYVNANGYIFENYLVYTLMSSEFLKLETDYSKAYAGFAGEFLMMLVFSAGIFHKNEKLNHDEMVVAMYRFHRNVSHVENLRKIFADSFTDNLLPFLFGALGEIK